MTLDQPKDRKTFFKLVHHLPEILECPHVAGDDDYILKVRYRNTRDLEQSITTRLKGTGGALWTRTTIVLSTEKETVQVPLPE